MHKKNKNKHYIAVKKKNPDNIYFVRGHRAVCIQSGNLDKQPLVAKIISASVNGGVSWNTGYVEHSVVFEADVWNFIRVKKEDNANYTSRVPIGYKEV